MTREELEKIDPDLIDTVELMSGDCYEPEKEGTELTIQEDAGGNFGIAIWRYTGVWNGCKGMWYPEDIRCLTYKS